MMINPINDTITRYAVRIKETNELVSTIDSFGEEWLSAEFYEEKPAAKDWDPDIYEIVQVELSIKEIKTIPFPPRRSRR